MVWNCFHICSKQRKMQPSTDPPLPFWHLSPGTAPRYVIQVPLFHRTHTLKYRIFSAIEPDHTYSLIRNKSIWTSSSIFNVTLLVGSADISKKQETIFTSRSHNGWAAEQGNTLETVQFVTQTWQFADTSTSAFQSWAVLPVHLYTLGTVMVTEGLLVF